MNRVVIIVQGGTVQAIHSDEDILIHVVDYDTMGIPEEEMQDYVMDIYDHPRQPDSIGMARAVLKEELSNIEKIDFDTVRSLSQFFSATGFSRLNYPTLLQLDEAMEQHGITSEDLIADIYGYFLY